MPLRPQRNRVEAPPPVDLSSENPEPTAAIDGVLTAPRAAVAIALGAALALLTAVGIRYTEMVTGRYISHGVPPLPAFTALLILSLLRPLLHRYAPRLAPTRAQILLVYVMLTVSTVLSGSYQVRAFLPHLVALQYHERPGGALAGRSNAGYLPPWYAPRDPKAIEDYYNGAHDHAVPWSVWLGPLALWSLFLLALLIGAYCMMLLVQRSWTRNERLSFPLLTLPMAMTAEDLSAYGSRRSRRSFFAMGFGAAALFNGLNILHILRPAVPSLGFYLSLGDYFPNRPLEPLGSITFYYMLEAIGIGYFVPLEVSFSVWFFYLCNRLFAVAGLAAGIDRPGFPYTQDQSAGGYLAVGLMLMWSLRQAWAVSLRTAFARPWSRRAKGSDLDDPAALRWAWIGLFASTLFVLGFCSAAGLSLRLAVPFFGVLGLFVLVYARIRAETGVPFGFIYPYGLPKEGLLNAVGFDTALGWGGTRSIVLFSSLAWLSRHHLAEEHAAYQLDGIKLSRETRIAPKTLTIALLIASVVGLGAAYWVHLSAYYGMGANMAGGGMGAGEFRAVVAQQEYQQMASRLTDTPVRDVARLAALSGGFAFTIALQWLRLRWLGSPFHPLGFVLSTAYGDSSAMWFPLLVAWMLKAAILRAGGLRFYRQGVPLFLGLTVGHFFMAGVFWPVLSLFLAPEASHAYHLYFGG